MKKRALLPLILASSLALFTACGYNSGNNGSIIILDDGTKAHNTALTVYGNNTDRAFREVVEDTLQNFMSSRSFVGVTYEYSDEVSYWQALDRRFATGNLDDVFMIDRDRLLTMTDSLADLSAVVSADALNDFASSQTVSADGKIYAVPVCISTYGLYINYGLLEEHGQAVPKNLSEFTAVCDYFVSAGITPIVCNNYCSMRSLVLARAMYDTYSQPGTDEKISSFNSDGALLCQTLSDGIDFVYEMIDSRWIDVQETLLTEQGDGDLQLFAEGGRPFMITTGRASSALKDMLEVSGSDLSYGVHAYPVLETGSVLVAQTDEMFCVKSGENEAQAKELLSLIAQSGTLLKLNEGQSCFSTVKGQTQIYSDSAIIPSASYLTKGKYVIGSDNNLHYPLDGYLTECATLIAQGESAQAVKAHLLALLNGYKAVSK